MRLIDADALAEVLGVAEECKDCQYDLNGFFCKNGNSFVSACEAIYDAPTIEDRKTGEWIIDGEFIDCSVCRREKWSRVPYEDLVKRFRYCPNCGAKMIIDPVCK